MSIVKNKYEYLGHAGADLSTRLASGDERSGLVSVRVFLSDDEGRHVYCTAAGNDADEAVAHAEDWANDECGSSTMAMDEWEAA